MSNLSKNKYSSLPTREYDNDDYASRTNSNSYKHGSLMNIKQSIKRQDESLDILSDSVSRLGEISLTISKEIELQNRMLSNLEDEIDDATDKAQSLTARTKELVKKSGGPKTFCLIGKENYINIDNSIIICLIYCL